MKLGIVTLAGDFHALAVKQLLDRRRDVETNIIEIDRLSASHSLSWSTNGEARVVLAREHCVNLNELTGVWWRRSRGDQRLDVEYEDPAHTDIVHNDCRAALRGAFETSFQGTWMSEPTSTERASNKLIQLAAARAEGFRIPRTLVSNSPSDVRQFIEECGGRVIVKAVAGTPLALHFTQFVELSNLPPDSSIEACPAIYQEFVGGTRHLRICQFGEQAYAGEITSEELDWRRQVNVTYGRTSIEPWIAERCARVLSRLGLEMGIIDIKLSEEGEAVWFEVNPQGQFLFLEPMIDVPLREIFAEFLVRRCSRRAKVASPLEPRGLDIVEHEI